MFLETGSPHDTATVATGFEWLAFDPPLDIELEHGEILYGLVDTGSGQQTLHMLKGVLAL